MIAKLKVLALALAAACGVFAAEWPNGAKCAVTYTFDDGLLDQYAVAYPILKAAGLKATFFVIAGKVGDPKGYRSKAERNTPLMTWENVKEMADGGMEIGSHSFSDVKAARTNREDYLADLVKAKAFTEEKVGGPCVSFAAPFNAKKTADGASVEEIAKEAGFKAMRMKQKGAGGAMTAEKMNALVENAKKKGEWLVFMTHGMNRGYDAWQNSDEFRKHIEWVAAQKDVAVMTFGDAAKRLERTADE